MKTFGLDNKQIVVTGAGGFLGKYICAALSDEGAEVIKIDVVESPGCMQLDITNRENVAELVKSGLKPYGVVNNAAACIYGSNIVGDDFARVMDVNISGTNNMIDIFGRAMIGECSVVNVASVYGMLSPDFRIYKDERWFNPSVYGATKAAIIQLTKYYATLLAPLRVNAVSPGGIFNNHARDFNDRYADRVPLKRMAEPEEVVNAIMFLLSPLSSYITGHNLVVSGGLDIL